MVAIEVFTEDERSIRAGLLGERAQELDHAVARYLPMLRKRALRFLGNAHDAEDAVQDALLSAYKHLNQFRGQAKLSTWLTAIVINAARMQLRRRGRVHLSLDQHSGEYDRAFSERLPDSKPGPEEIYFSSGAHDWLANGVKQLSPTLRRTLQLRDIDGLTTKEAALVLGVPEGTVKAQISRARAKLVGLMRAKPDGRRLARQSTENLTKLA